MTIENAALLALVALLPLVVLTLTSFVKVSVVLSLVRNAIGATDAPSGLVITGLSLVLTFFVMAPVAVDMVTAASTAPSAPPQPGSAPGPTTPAPGPTTPAPTTPAPTTPAPTTPAPTTPAPTTPAPTSPAPGPSTTQPGATQPGTAAQATAEAGSATADGASEHGNPPPRQLDVLLQTLVPAQYKPQLAAIERGLGPLRDFLAKHTRDADRETFRGLAAQLGHAVTGNELWVLAPAFITTELREAFMIAILIFVPFLVIDLVVALSLAALGLSSTSPQTVALPLKLVLFVAVDGWRLLLDGLLRGYV